MRHLTLTLTLLACSPGSLAPPDRTPDTDWTPTFAVVPDREPCSAAKLARVLDTNSRDGVLIDCHLTLPPNSRVERQLLFVGERSSGVTLDCQGSTIGDQTANGGSDTIIVRSRFADGTWEPVHDILISGCTIHGSIRIYGIGRNGESPAYVASSYQDPHMHVAYVRNAAPYHVQIDSSAVLGRGRVPVYLGPGVHHSGLTSSLVRGSSRGPLVYLDAESTGNLIRDCQLSAGQADGPAIAVDASSANRLEHNRLSRLANGGVYLYSCHRSEAGRVTTPRANRIVGNVFGGCEHWPGIWLGARPACGRDWVSGTVAHSNDMGNCHLW